MGFNTDLTSLNDGSPSLNSSPLNFNLKGLNRVNVSGVIPPLPDVVLSALGGLTVGAAARLLTGLTNGQSVDTFTNAAGGVTLTNAGTASPIYTTNVVAINSQPSLTFDGTNDRLIVSALPFATGNSPFSIYVVFRAGSSALTRNVFRIGGGTTRRGIGLNIPSGGSSLLRFETISDVLDVTCSSTTNAKWIIAAMRYDSSVNTLRGDVYGDVTGTGSKVLGGAANWTPVLFYDSIASSAAATSMLSGSLPELWIYNQHHSDADRNAAVNRLKAIYNLP